jgi:hypothetical protein
MTGGSKNERALARRQGWTDHNLLGLARNFIDSRGLYGQFEEFLEDHAREEETFAGGDEQPNARDDEPGEYYTELGGEG